ELPPQYGRIKHGTHLEVIYFDQLRGQLDENKTVQENVSPAGDMMDVGGKSRHVIGYLKDFLFSPQRSRTPVWVLSGGEKNRLLLAKLFARPANVLVLDEPTNDLDVNTLRALEEGLDNFAGCAVIISHDRWFLDRICTHILAFEGESQTVWFEGNYADYEVDRKRRLGADADMPTRIKYRKIG
ncbi:MAG: ATP-binding cassette domain-containing protein, partial [Kangiellaceae bacterium]|nr:ATP-binding cassette domain-containing protein [Kangiellaceae bacterium]